MMSLILQKFLSFFSSNKSRAIAEGIITLEEYLQIPIDERKTIKYLFSPNGRQAIAEGVITLEQYLKIPPSDRSSMQYLFSADGRQALAEGIITVDQYLQIPDDQREDIMAALRSSDRSSMQYLFSADGLQALAEGIITVDQYLQIPDYERRSMLYLFSTDGRQAVIDGFMTFERYLQIPWDERWRMQYLFSRDGRQAIIDGIFTLEQYLKIPRWDAKKTIKNLFLPKVQRAITEGIFTFEQYLLLSTNEYLGVEFFFSLDDYRQAIAEGIITFEQYLQFTYYERRSLLYLFSADGQQAIAEGIITVDQYLQIPDDQREDIMAALRYPDVRQRIINGELTIENIIDLYPVRHPIDDAVDVTPNFNGAQSTHTASVHYCVSESAIRLANRYQLEITGPGLEKTLAKVQIYIENLSDDSEKNTAAKRCLLRILAPNYFFIDPESKASIKQLLALVYLAIHDSKNRQGELEDAETQFVEGLYEIQRGYNLSESGIDKGGFDQPICMAGTFNKLIEKLQGIHPDCQVRFITKQTASSKLPIVALEETKKYLKKFAKSHTDEAHSHLITQLKNEGVEIIWEHIKDNIVARMFDEFGSLFKGITDPNFVQLIDAGKNIELDHLSEFQQPEQSSSDLNQPATDIETQEESVIGSKETALVEIVKNVKLASSNPFEQKTIQGIDDLKIQKEIVEGVIEDAYTLQQEERPSCSYVVDINQKNSIYNQIDLQLNKLENKAKNLRDRNHIQASCKACNIIYRLRDLNHNYFIKKKINYKLYKEKALDIINQERPELDKHRGFKQIIGNLLILITTLGTGHLINKICTGNLLFFKTNSAKYVDELAHTIKEMGVCLIP